MGGTVAQGELERERRRRGSEDFKGNSGVRLL